jgi:phosphoribosylanthranilate isomerase
VLVKICGITHAEDAAAAVECGAAALGFVFWPGSPRFIDPHRAHAIVAGLPPFVTTVGVFVNQPADYVTGVASLVRLGAVQLHGDEAADYAAGISTPVIKAVTVANPQLSTWPAHTMLLLDVHDPEKRGGTGRTVEWTAAAAIAAQRKILLAGGLTPENVIEAVSRVRPFGIDVSSGVEAVPGQKDPRKLRRFIEAAQSVDAEAVEAQPESEREIDLRVTAAEADDEVPGVTRPFDWDLDT